MNKYILMLPLFSAFLFCGFYMISVLVVDYNQERRINKGFFIKRVLFQKEKTIE